jgi:hypothetical protein
MINGELQDVLALVKHVFMEFEAPDYSAEGVQSFLKFIEADSIQKMFDDGILK